MSNLVTTIGIDISADVISVNGSTLQNQKRVERLQAALQELLDNFEGKIWYGRARLASEVSERGDFGY